MATPGTVVTVRFQLVDARGVVVAACTATQPVGAAASGAASATGAGHPTTATLKAPPLKLAAAELWSVARPYLYTLVARVDHATSLTPAYDLVNTSIGVRGVVWDPAGLLLNTQRIKMRGFCNHESFAGVGAAIPPRIDLFRVQQMRGVGGNAWRTSHNPPEPALLHVTDRLGVIVLDENRVFATATDCPGGDGGDPNNTCTHGYIPMYAGDPAADAGKLALRDRHHASVAWYSLCNEAGCGPGSLLGNRTAERCKGAIHAVDASRAITGNVYNMQSPNAVVPGAPLSSMFDVMGVSHQGGDVMDAWHEGERRKLIVATECCSCGP